MPDTAELSRALNRMSDQLEATQSTTVNLRDSFDKDKSFRRRQNILSVLGFTILAFLTVMSIDHQFDIARQQKSIEKQQDLDRANRCDQLRILRSNIIIGVDAVLDRVGEAVRPEDLQTINEAKLALRDSIPPDACEGFPN